MVDETLSLTELRTRIETLSKGPMLRGWVYCEAAPLAEFINQYADDRAAALEAELTQARAERDAARRALDKLAGRVELFTQGAAIYSRQYVYDIGDEMTVEVTMSFIDSWGKELKKEIDEARAAIKAAEKGR